MIDHMGLVGLIADNVKSQRSKQQSEKQECRVLQFA